MNMRGKENFVFFLIFFFLTEPHVFFSLLGAPAKKKILFADFSILFGHCWCRALVLSLLCLCCCVASIYHDRSG